MIGGCLKNIFAALGCVTVLVFGTMVGWRYRTQFVDAYRAFRGVPVVAAAAFDEGPGRPSADGLRSALRKHERMSRLDGPELVSMSAAEIASRIRDGLDPLGRRALDSLTVTLEEGRFVMEAVLVTEVWGRDALGLLGGLLRPFEPVRVAGPARIERRGVMAWEPLEFSVRSLPFPGVAIPPIVNRLTGGDTGLILLVVPTTVADIRISPGKATLYRRRQ